RGRRRGRAARRPARTAERVALLPADAGGRARRGGPGRRTRDGAVERRMTASAAWAPPSRARVARIRDRLRTVYGRPSAPPHRRPLDELILTVLSQSTNDRNRDVAFARLRDRFGSWAAVRDAPVDEVEEAIRPGGISKVKSERIQQILRAIGEPLSLDSLADLTVPESRAQLVALPGVGKKTAACVLLFSFGMRDVPVDTHVSRVGA